MPWDDVGPPFSQSDRQVLFLFGPARGGTTFLNNLLYRHFGFGMGPEGTFIDKFARRLARYGNLDVEENLSRLIEDISECEMLYIARHKYRRQPFDVTPELIRARLRERSFAGVVYSVFECMAEVQNCHYVGNKNPRYWKYFDLLDRLFPDQAKYLCILRDGRDVALSNMKTRWGGSSVYVCAEVWVSMVRVLAQMQARFAEDRLMVVRYEDLLQHPERSLAAVRDFLVPELPDENVEGAVAEIVQGGLRSNFDKWRKQMSSDDLRIYEAIAGDWLTRHGYERSVSNPSVRLPERLWYPAKEYARLLKLNLRARTNK